LNSLSIKISTDVYRDFYILHQARSRNRCIKWIFPRQDGQHNTHTLNIYICVVCTQHNVL